MIGRAERGHGGFRVLGWRGFSPDHDRKAEAPQRQTRQFPTAGRVFPKRRRKPMPHVNANGLDLYYESHGPESAEPILLIMGLGAQMSRWSPELIGKLTGAGHRVIAFDNRDVGLSEKLDDAGAPDMHAVAI